MDIDIKKLKRHRYDRTVIRGIYYLFNKWELVYIGQSENIIRRINEHTNKEFDEFSYIEIDRNIWLEDIEKEEIRKYKPRLNKNLYEKSTKNRLSALFNLIRRMWYKIPPVKDNLLYMSNIELWEYIKEKTNMNIDLINSLVVLRTTEINKFRNAIWPIM